VIKYIDKQLIQYTPSLSDRNSNFETKPKTQFPLTTYSTGKNFWLIFFKEAVVYKPEAQLLQHPEKGSWQFCCPLPRANCTVENTGPGRTHSDHWVPGQNSSKSKVKNVALLKCSWVKVQFFYVLEQTIFNCCDVKYFICFDLWKPF
jgi:hypothetical protein